VSKGKVATALPVGKKPLPADTSVHELVRLEDKLTDTGVKFRYVCKCGSVGLFVGSANIDGESWAHNAFVFHATNINYTKGI
jgi:hypothetical protein